MFGTPRFFCNPTALEFERPVHRKTLTRIVSSPFAWAPMPLALFC